MVLAYEQGISWNCTSVAHRFFGRRADLKHFIHDGSRRVVIANYQSILESCTVRNVRYEKMRCTTIVRILYTLSYWCSFHPIHIEVVMLCQLQV